MAAALFVGFAASDEKLSATGRHGRPARSTHRMHREKTHQDKMNQRNKQTLAKRAELLTRDATGEGGIGSGHERCHPRQRIRREPHVGINKNK